MSAEKIDLADVEKYPLFVPEEVLFALLRAVRAARALLFCNAEDALMFEHELEDALAPFTDSGSAEVK